MVLRYLHVERRAAVAKILASKDSTLLANEKRSAVRVAADVIGADGQIGDLEAFDAVDVEALIEDAVLDDGVAVLRSHGARAERVPGGLNVAWNMSAGWNK
tara:strand:- start:8761 stop:9063 length:303 start_codon:yes stop_codon:yes gene_type:complete